MASAGCILASFLLPYDRWRLALMLCALILLCVAGIKLALLVWMQLRGRHQRDMAASMIAHDHAVGFVADADRRITFSNKMALHAFSTKSGAHLNDALGQMLASPDGIMQALLAKAQQSGSAMDDIVTRSGHVRLQVLQLGPDCFVWRVNNFETDVAVSSARADTPPIPMMQVGREGAIVLINKQFRQLLNDEPMELTDVFDDLPLRTGQVHTLSMTDQTCKHIVADVPLANGGRTIYLLPGAENMQSPPQLNAGWDTIEDLPVPLLKLDRRGQIVGATRQARQLLRISETTAGKIGDVLNGPGRPIDDWLAEAAKGQVGHTSEFLRGRGDNRETFVQVTLSVMNEGEKRYLVAVLNDVTELKTLEAQFVQSQKMQAIGQLAGGVAHDFNNLLTAISGHCDLLLLRHDEGDQNYSDLIQIHQNANRAASLVGQLLAFSRKQNLQLETIDLRETLSDLMHLLNRLVGEKVTLTLDHDSDLQPIRADKRQLEQVLMNLVVNARDAMDGAGNISVITQNRSFDAEVRRDRAIIPAGDYVLVKVVDQGMGIAPDKLTKIFEPFYTTKKTGEGTGLGLSTAYGIVKQTGGFIFAESVVGEGTTFSLLLPCFRSDAAPQFKRAEPVETNLLATGEGVILLVEDEAPVRAFASRALSLKGFTVLEADCAETALSMLEDTDLHVDLFVTDVIMPGKDGPSWVREAREKRPDTKVVFVSGYPEDAFEGGEASIKGAMFLPKPFSLKDLTQTVQSQINQPIVRA